MTPSELYKLFIIFQTVQHTFNKGTFHVTFEKWTHKERKLREKKCVSSAPVPSPVHPYTKWQSEKADYKGSDHDAVLNSNKARKQKKKVSISEYFHMTIFVIWHQI